MVLLLLLVVWVCVLLWSVVWWVCWVYVGWCVVSVKCLICYCKVCLIGVVCLVMCFLFVVTVFCFGWSVVGVECCVCFYGFLMVWFITFCWG